MANPIDIRGVPVTPLFAFSQLTGLPGAPAGFTAGAHYWPLGLAYDNGNNVVYVITADDAGVLHPVAAQFFSFAIQGLELTRSNP